MPLLVASQDGIPILVLIQCTIDGPHDEVDGVIAAGVDLRVAVKVAQFAQGLVSARAWVCQAWPTAIRSQTSK